LPVQAPGNTVYLLVAGYHHILNRVNGTFFNNKSDTNPASVAGEIRSFAHPTVKESSVVVNIHEFVDVGSYFFLVVASRPEEPLSVSRLNGPSEFAAFNRTVAFEGSLFDLDSRALVDGVDDLSLRKLVAVKGNLNKSKTLFQIKLLEVFSPEVGDYYIDITAFLEAQQRHKSAVFERSLARKLKADRLDLVLSQDTGRLLGSPVRGTHIEHQRQDITNQVRLLHPPAFP